MSGVKKIEQTGPEAESLYSSPCGMEIPLTPSQDIILPGGKIFRPRPVSVRKLPCAKKYASFSSQFAVENDTRAWPSKQITKTPIWCSVDLRDGNQALINPLTIEQKLIFFQYLVALNFKEIEIGFPSASTTEFEFTRCLIENKLIPDSVTPQVLTQSRDPLIERSFEALKGCKKAIVHLYNSTSTLQRRVVYQKDKHEIIDIAVKGTTRIKQLAQDSACKTILEYSPESFTGTELPFAYDICRAVLDVWQPTAENKLIFNWPATVEMSTPNVYADQIEWMCNQFHSHRDSLIFSVHPHNDRGTGVAAAELALLAGADRIEGTLFGNGERTGNVDIVTLALNLYSQGIEPELLLGDIPRLAELTGELTELPIHERHPYAGQLVFTAFSGSHQDAIRKGLEALKSTVNEHWEVPYLTLDPADIGRAYEPLVRINSQSGKGGVAYVLEHTFGYTLPKKMHPEVSAIVQQLSETTGREVLSQDIFQAFSLTFISPPSSHYHLINFSSSVSEDDSNGDASNAVECQLQVRHLNGEVHRYSGAGNGPIDACRDALIRGAVPHFRLLDYSEHSLAGGSNAQAAAYIQVELENGQSAWGVGQHANTTKAAVSAMLNALNRVLHPS